MIRVAARRSLVYLDNRSHDPKLGVFISVDPLVMTRDNPSEVEAHNVGR